MTLKTLSIAALISIGVMAESTAATKIISTNQLKQKLDVIIDKNMARFNGSGNSQYQLINLSTKKIYNVNFDQGIILDASVPVVAGNNDIKLPKIELKELGDGPEVAGFPTQQYQVYANKILCETLFVSKKATRKIPDMKKFIKVMGDIAKSGRGSMRKGASGCRIAKTEIFDQFSKLGTLMKSVSARGKVTFEITDVETNIEIASGYFDLPKTLELTTMKELMEKMKRQMQQ